MALTFDGGVIRQGSYMDHANYRPSSVILRGFPDHAELDLDAILGGSAVFLVNENENENYNKF